MSAVGLFYVGAVLILNGLLLLGVVSAKGAAPLNLFVGGLQVVVPTALLIRADDPAAVFEAAPLYLFGFTYLWVGINAAMAWDQRGLGWFSLFVSVTAVAVSVYNGAALGDGPFAVIWLYWAVLWFLFFLVLGLDTARLSRLTGWFAIVTGVVTAAVPGALLVVGLWPAPTAAPAAAITTGALALIGAAALLLPALLGGRGHAPAASAPGG
ncbi:AmiS/UreI family transporter [Murinocardiopsis flavida]|uniref:AmiS/UreI family transporter n=1 Tax=Murinocardiopsis flavida TaxID=645275 RepID=A0A2P8DEN2_9ACTN|nr:AmiS/UreI family transporter [Murinocardiopsis flavida]PSK95691.1 AmiS/UreI family transporter [Murinocardiopsis flavida]